jgi:uncharacterized membrane protein
MTKYEVPEGLCFLCVVVVRWISTNDELRSTGRAVFLAKERFAKAKVALSNAHTNNEWNG